MSPLLGAFDFRNPEQIIGPAICHIAIHIVHAFFALRIWDESLCYKIVQTFAESLPAAVIQRHAHPATGVIRLEQVVGRLVSYPPVVRHLVIVKAIDLFPSLTHRIYLYQRYSFKWVSLGNPK